MLSSFDDYPIHQTSRPINEPASGDLNHYDRYFFNGYDAAGEVFFAAAFGVYPNKGIVDAAFSVVTDGVQRNVYAAGRAPMDRTKTTVGPMTITIEEPMRRLRVSVAPNEHGPSAELVFGARSLVVEEPRFERVSRGRTTMDYTRLTQWGTWAGHIEIDGARIEISPEKHRGCRDRSWGIRSVGEQLQAPGLEAPQFFWLWSPLNFDDCCVHVDVQESADGSRWHGFGAIVPTLESPSEPTIDPSRIDVAAAVDHSLVWKSGTRNAESASLELRFADGRAEHIELTPMLTFFMNGAGYFHPERGHGSWHGELSVTGDSWRTDEVDRTEFRRFHIQELVSARWGDRVGVGILEQLVIGAHEPSGFVDVVGVAP